MIGKVIKIKHLDNGLSEITLLCKENVEITTTVPDIPDSSLGRYLSVSTSAVLLDNSNFDYNYPEGTIGVK